METPTQPIRPDEVSGKHQSTIPNIVIETFNEMIVKNFSGGGARIIQDDILAVLASKGLSSADIFNNRWLDVEDLYRKNGWRVEYDKPGFNEFYSANFTFTKKRKR